MRKNIQNNNKKSYTFYTVLAVVIFIPIMVFIPPILKRVILNSNIMLKKQILLKVNSKDFIQLVNSGKIKVNSEDLKFIKDQIKIKPTFNDSIISVYKKDIYKSLKANLNNHSLTFQLC